MAENMDLSPYRPKGTVPFSRRKGVIPETKPSPPRKSGQSPRERLPCLDLPSDLVGRGVFEPLLLHLHHLNLDEVAHHRLQNLGGDA